MSAGSLDPRLDAEGRRRLEEWNATAAEYPKDKCIHAPDRTVRPIDLVLWFVAGSRSGLQAICSACRTLVTSRVFALPTVPRWSPDRGQCPERTGRRRCVSSHSRPTP